MGEVLDPISQSQIFSESEVTKQLRQRLGIHNKMLKLYAATLMARYGNPQVDNAAPPNMEGVTNENKMSVSALAAISQQEIITIISKQTLTNW